MGVPTTPTLDLFDRGNGPLGANWTTLTAIDAPTILSNACTNPDGNPSGALWNPSTFGADQEAYLTMTAAGGTSNAVLLRFNSASGSGYRIVYVVSGHLYRIDSLTGGGSGASILSSVAGPVAVNGDKLLGQCVGGRISVSLFAGGSWSEILALNDTTYTSPGLIGLWQRDNSDSADNFGGGVPVTRPQVLLPHSVSAALRT